MVEVGLICHNMARVSEALFVFRKHKFPGMNFWCEYSKEKIKIFYSGVSKNDLFFLMDYLKSQIRQSEVVFIEDPEISELSIRDMFFISD